MINAQQITLFFPMQSFGSFNFRDIFKALFSFSSTGMISSHTVMNEMFWRLK